MIKNKKFDDRYEVLSYIFIGIFSIMILRLSYMTIIKGDEYYNEAQNKVYKKIPIEAPRGEIRDKYGRLLAGNKPSFTVQISKDEAPNDSLNETSKKLIKILENNGEQYIDEFPIVMQGNSFSFTFDSKVSEWKQKNNIPNEFNAEESFYYIVDDLIKNGEIDVDKNMDKLQLQKALNEKGYYPPIYVSSWQFAEEKKKEEWLYRYKIRNEDVKKYKDNPKKTFNAIRDYFNIEESLSNIEARKIMIVRDLLKSQGYLQYQPVKIAMDVKKETVSKVEEMSVELPGVSVEVEPIRHYPNGNLAAHILGQLGKISQAEEIDKYVKKNGYNTSDIIGKTGIEKKYEDVLHGQKGYKKVVVDSSGRLVKKIESKSPTSGNTVYLTIDKDLQEAAEKSLEEVLKTIQVGGTYQSEWGNVRLRDSKKAFTKATSGAVVALDVKSGDVLAMASYPDYDPNLFVTGISKDDMQKLIPENENDMLAPKPLYNTATFTSVQPGSTFKMIPGLAGIDNGLSPRYAVTDLGRIMLGNKSFGCWIWNDKKGNHGSVDLLRALEESCNYYFYCISSGYDYSRNKPLPVKMNVEEVLKYARMFGLDEATGIQIEEIPGKVPNPAEKLKSTKRALDFELHRKLRTYFEDIDPDEDKEEFDKRISEIVSWADENPSRGTIIKRLGELHIKEDKILDVTDTIKYSYFNQADWKTGDTFNLAIGQGAHAYTPLQMANYISGLVNGGYKNKVTVVDKVESLDKMNVDKVEREKEKIPLNDDKNLDYIKAGMLKVTDEGTARSTFGNFPIQVGGKTGTAEKSGRIPTKDEYEYLLSHISSFKVDAKEALALAEKYQNTSKENKKPEYYLRKAIQNLNPSISDEQINRFKDTYDNFAWFVGFAPYDEPEIAVVSMIFQGGHGGYGGPIVRDVIAEYFGIKRKKSDEDIKERLNLDNELQR